MNSDELARRLADLMKKGNPIEMSGNQVSVNGVPIEDDSTPQIERKVRSRKTRSNPRLGKIKVLVYRFEAVPNTSNTRTVVYVAGDRPGATRVYALPVGAVLTYGKIHNLGTGDRWVIVLVYQFGGLGDTHLVMLESGKKQVISPTPLFVGGETHTGYGFFQYPVYETPFFNETLTPPVITSTRNVVFTGTGYTATFSGEELRGKTYEAVPGSGWTGGGTETSELVYSGTSSLTVSLNSPIPPDCVPTRYIFIREATRILLHDYENSFYTVVPPTVRDALLLEKQVEYFQTQPSVPLIRRYFKIRWDANYEQIVQWNVDSDPSVGPEYLVNLYNSGIDSIPFNAGSFTSDLQVNKELSATGSQAYTLYRDQVTTKGRTWSRVEASQVQVNNEVTTSTSSFTENFASQAVLAPAIAELVKPYTVTQSGVNGTITETQETYGTAFFAKREGIYGSDSTGTPPKLFYWSLDKDDNFSEIELAPVPQDIPAIGTSGNLIKGVLYRLTDGVPILNNPSQVNVSRLQLQPMQEKTSKFPVFPLTKPNSYFYLDASFHPN